MKKASVFVALMAVLSVSSSPAFAEDKPVVSGVKKVGTAIVWPFKKVGEGMKAVFKKMK